MVSSEQRKRASCTLRADWLSFSFENTVWRIFWKILPSKNIAEILIRSELMAKMLVQHAVSHLQESSFSRNVLRELLSGKPEGRLKACLMLTFYPKMKYCVPTQALRITLDLFFLMWNHISSRCSNSRSLKSMGFTWQLRKTPEERNHEFFTWGEKFPVFLLASSLDAAILPLLLAFILTEYAMAQISAIFRKEVEQMITVLGHGPSALYSLRNCIAAYKSATLKSGLKSACILTTSLGQHYY